MDVNKYQVYHVIITHLDTTATVRGILFGVLRGIVRLKYTIPEKQ